MKTTDVEHPSRVLRATHILRIRINDARLGPWRFSPTRRTERLAEIRITPLEALKGAVGQHPGEDLQLRVFQYSSGSHRLPAAPGVWSNIPLEPGTELMAFCHNYISRVIEDLLGEDSCEQILPTKGNLDDVRLAVQAESASLSAVAIVDLALTHARALGYVFAEYLWAKLADTSLRDLPTFEALMRLLETPELTLIARWSLLREVYAATVYSLRPSPEHVHRLALTLFHLLEVSKDPSVTDNIVQVFLPNLLGIQGGLPQRNADDVFADAAEERSKVEAILGRYQGSASTQTLLAWLRAGQA